MNGSHQRLIPTQIKDTPRHPIYYNVQSHEEKTKQRRTGTCLIGKWFLLKGHVFLSSYLLKIAQCEGDLYQNNGCLSGPHIALVGINCELGMFCDLLEPQLSIQKHEKIRTTDKCFGALFNTLTRLGRERRPGNASSVKPAQDTSGVDCPSISRIRSRRKGKIQVQPCLLQGSS